MSLRKKVVYFITFTMLFIFFSSCVSSNQRKRPFDYKKTQHLKKTHKDCGCPF